MGQNGAVATNHPQATAVGIDILRSGGNAFDASVAVSLALGVVEPAMSGLGGDGFYHVWVANSGQTIVYNGTGPAPEAANKDCFSKAGIPTSGPLSTSTPGLVGGISALHQNHGTQRWSMLCDAAAELADSGFFVTRAYQTFAEDNLEKLNTNKISKEIFTDDGSVPPVGTKIIQPQLATTLRRLGDDGADGFYRGAIAKILSEDAQSSGLMLTDSDFANFWPETQTSISTNYRGFEIYQTPLNSTGFVLLEELKILEQFDITKFDYGSADLIHLMVEIKKRAFLDRERYGTDPRFTDSNVEELLCKDHALSKAAMIDMSTSSNIPLMPSQQKLENTTYFCIIDKDGNAVSAIQSINSAFGSGVTGSKTGILFNNRMAYWHLDDEHPNLLRPGKRVRHTMNAPIITQNGKLWGVFGTPGADNQVQINFQVAVALMDYGFDPQQAVEVARWTSSQPNQAANWPHEGNSCLTLERGVDGDALRDLEQRGHDIKTVAPLAGPCSVACIRVLENGTIMAGSDPRRDGWAAAY
jgi:gamma-glutamyltranspeptidase